MFGLLKPRSPNKWMNLCAEIIIGANGEKKAELLSAFCSVYVKEYD